MMKWLASIIVASTMASAGVKPIGTLISLGPVQLNAIRMAAPAVWSWLVASGDEITTEDWTATLLLPNKSRVTLDHQTRVRVNDRGGTVAVTLIGGRLGYFATQPSALSITSNRGPIAMAPPTGTVSLQAGKLVLEPAIRIPVQEIVAPPTLPRLGAYAAAQN